MQVNVPSTWCNEKPEKISQSAGTDPLEVREVGLQSLKVRQAGTQTQPQDIYVRQPAAQQPLPPELTQFVERWDFTATCAFSGMKHIRPRVG
jgi:hypothetical protein